MRQHSGKEAYLYLEQIVIKPNRPPAAKIEYEIMRKSGEIVRETKVLNVDDNLYDITGREAYKGYRISAVDPISQQVTFTNGEIIAVSEVFGDDSESNIRRIQIRETILSHFEKEEQLFNMGIKTLSLFFIDEGAHYRCYDENGTPVLGDFGVWFEAEYESVLNEFKAKAKGAYKQAKEIYRYLLKNDYVDNDDNITHEYRDSSASGRLAELPESLKPIADGVHSLIQSVFDTSILSEMFSDASLTRKTVATILSSIERAKLEMYRNNPEEFITKMIRLIKDEKSTMIVEHITYTPTDEEPYSADIFTEKKGAQDYSKAFKAEKAIQDYVFTDGYAQNGESVERRFAKDLDAAQEVCVYAKLPRGFSIPTPVGNYSPDWAIAFNQGMVKHIFFVAETKGTLDSMNLKPVEKNKIRCARKLFNEISTTQVRYHDVSSYQELLNVMDSIK